MHRVFLGVGGNQGNKQENFHKVHLLIEKELGKIVLQSSVYETEPWGFRSASKFWNQVIVIETNLLPNGMLLKINEIETSFGRKRSKEKYSSRPMDIDILYFDNLVIHSEKLDIPHPHIPERKFVLVPLAEIAPDFVHPELRKNSLQMLADCMDESKIKILV